MQQRVPISIALNLRRLRAERGVSLSELARNAGVSKGTLSRLEAGSGNPRVETMANLAGALGVTIDDLITDEGSRVRVVRSTGGTWVRGSAVGYRLMDRLLGLVFQRKRDPYIKGRAATQRGIIEEALQYYFETRSK